MPLYLRNLATGRIKQVEPESEEFAKLKAERTEDGRFPVWEQTGAHDADPKNAAASFEVENRAQWDADIHDVTTDGVLQTGKGQLGEGDVQFAARKSSSGGSSSSGSSKK